MSTTLQTKVSPHSPFRVLRREWKLYKPHLPKSTSLPALQLKPFNRPLFTCRRCGYTNSLIPLCLWCAWTSPEATEAWEASLPRCRTISAPTRVFWDATSDKVEQLRPRTSLKSVASTMSPITPRSPNLDIPGTGIRSAGSGDAYVQVVKGSDVPQGGDVAECPLQPEDQYSALQSPVWLKDGGNSSTRISPSGRMSSRPAPLFLQVFDPEPADNVNHTLVTEPETIRHSQLPPSMLDQAVASRRHLRLPSSRSPTPCTPTPPHTLRRKKRMTILRQKSSCSLRSRLRVDDKADRPCTPSSVRLGTPSRPYYTAIRKNMSQPSPPPTRSTSPSPSPCPSPLPPPSYILPLSMSVYSDSEEDLPTPRPRSQTLIPHPRHSGFSLSGEVELHIALSKERSPEYRFRETCKDRGKGKGSGVRGKVKKVGKGFKGFVLGRAWCQAA